MSLDPTPDESLLIAALNMGAQSAYQNSAAHGFWDQPRNKGEMLMLVVSEVAECLEGIRKGLADDHLPHRSMEECEMADVLIRCLDYCGGFGIDLGGAVIEKMRYNAGRPRLHGKAF